MATPIPRNGARFSLAEVADATGGELLLGRAPQPVVGVVTDSRGVQAGNLYVALRGERYDGHAFVAPAFASGAVAALVHDRSVLPAGASAVVVSDTLRALGQLAALHRRRWGGRVIAITGSAGKTTTKELTFAALRAAGAKVVRSEGNLNNLIGAPMSLLCLDAQSELCVLEVGTSAPGEIARLAEISGPTVGVVTTVAAAHTTGLGSLEQVAREKAALLWALGEGGTAVYREDDAALIGQLGCLQIPRRLTFGRSDRSDVQLVSHAIDAAPSMLCALRFGHSASTVRCQLKLFGAGPALDAAAAMAVVLAVLGEAVIERAVTGLGVVAPSPGRLCPLPGPAGALILDDSYNANPASMRASIDTALQLARARGGRVLLVLGDMLELGQGSRAEHESIGRQAAQVGVAAFIACGLEMTAAAETAREKARQDALDLSIAHLGDPLAVAEILRPLLREGDVVLVKGSRSMGMERVVERLAPHGGGTP